MDARQRFQRRAGHCAPAPFRAKETPKETCSFVRSLYICVRANNHGMRKAKKWTRGPLPQKETSWSKTARLGNNHPSHPGRHFSANARPKREIHLGQSSMNHSCSEQFPTEIIWQSGQWTELQPFSTFQETYHMATCH